MKNYKKTAIICGATGSGKSDLAIAWAKQHAAAVISCDSMQIFKGLNIGTAKVSPAEREAVPHYLLDIVEAKDNYSIANYLHDYREVKAKLDAMQQSYIVVGGSLQYVLALLRDDDYQLTSVDSDPEYRAYLEAKYDAAIAGSPNPLYVELQNLDPKRAASLHPNDKRRIVRALEIIHCTGKLASAGDPRNLLAPPSQDYVLFAVAWEREKLYERINQRVDIMMADGLLEEAKQVYSQRVQMGQTCLQAIAYKEFFPYFAGKIDLATAVSELKKNSRHYAKRQISIMRQLDLNYLRPEWSLAEKVAYIDQVLAQSAD